MNCTPSLSTKNRFTPLTCNAELENESSLVHIEGEMVFVRGTPYSNLFFIIFPCFSLFFYIFSVIISFFYRFYLISRPFFTRSIRFSHAYVIPLRTIFLRIYLYLFIFLCALQHIYITITSSPFASVTYRCTGRGGSLELSLWILSCPGVYPYCTYRSM